MGFSVNDIAGRNGALSIIVALVMQEVFGESGPKREKLIQDIKEMTVSIPNPEDWSKKAKEDFARGFLGVRDGFVGMLEKKQNS